MKNLIIVLIISFFALSHAQVTFCEKYAAALGINDFALVSTAVNLTVAQVVNASNGILQYFNGSVSGVPNFLTNAPALSTLETSLYEFFGMALGCNDSTIGPYTGNLLAAHTPLNTNYFAYSTFNNLVSGVLVGLGVAAADVTAVATVLDTVRNQTCIQSDCTTPICNKYSVPYNLNNIALVSLVVNLTVLGPNGLLANSQILPFFNGQTPAGSTNFTDPSQAAAFTTLFNHLVQFFGSALGCSDGTIGAYQGNPNLTQVHLGMPITLSIFNQFNNILLAVMQSLGVTSTDLNTVGALLNSTIPVICPQCGVTPAPTPGTTPAPTPGGTTPAPTPGSTPAPTPGSSTGDSGSLIIAGILLVLALLF